MFNKKLKKEIQEQDYRILVLEKRIEDYHRQLIGMINNMRNQFAYFNESNMERIIKLEKKNKTQKKREKDEQKNNESRR